MRILAEVLGELFGMFVADFRLTISVLALVAVVGALTFWLNLGAIFCGVALLGGSILILVEAASREARRRK